MPVRGGRGLWRQNRILINRGLPSHTDLYSSSLLTQALISREGSLASLLIQDRAEMLQMELPSLTTRRLALVSFPAWRRGGQPRTHQPPPLLHQSTDYRLPKNKTIYASRFTVPVAMSKRKEKMLPLSSPAQRILPGASKDSDSTRPVSLLEPPFTFFPVEMFTTCRWCLLFPTCTTMSRERGKKNDVRSTSFSLVFSTRFSPRAKTL